MIIWQRWGTFSVRDHLKELAFVAEVLLYDRLVVPAPPENNKDEEQRWEQQGWRPDRLLALLEIIGQELSSRIPWNEEMQGRFRTRLAATRQVDEAVSYGLTALLVAGVPIEAYQDEFPALPPDEPKPHVLPAYPSPAALREEIRVAPLTSREKRRQRGGSREEERDLAVTLMRKVLMPRGILQPRGMRMGTELLRDAVGLAPDDEYKQNRRRFYEWEETQLLKGRVTQESLDEIRDTFLGNTSGSSDGHGRTRPGSAF